jgi:uncharacterized protein involved in exopolysaccharide biosynthesis
MMVGIFIILLSGVLLGTYLITPRFEATAKILVHRNPDQQPILFKDITSPGLANPNINPAYNIVDIAKSRGIAEGLVKAFGFDKRLYKRQEAPESLRDIILYYIRIVLESPITLAQNLGLLEEKEPNYLEDAIGEFLEDSLEIELIQDTELVNLTILEESPKLATDIANTMASMLIEKMQDLDRLTASSAYEFAKEQAGNAERSLMAAEEELALFKEKETIVSLDKEKELQIRRLDELTFKQIETGMSLREASSKLAEIKRQLRRQEEKIISSSVVTNNPIIFDLKTSLNGLEQKLASSKSERTETHPDIVDLKAQITTLTEKLKQEIEKIVQSETTTLNPVYMDLTAQLVNTIVTVETLKAKDENLRAQIDALREENRNLVRKEIMLSRLERNVATHKERHTTLKSKFLELEVQRFTQISELDIRVVDRAFAPDSAKPESPKWILNLLVGGFLGILISFGLAFVGEYWQESLKTAKETEEYLDIPVLGSISTHERDGKVFDEDIQVVR